MPSLLDASGAALATYRVENRGDWMQADVIGAVADPLAAAAELARSLPGWRVATADQPLAEALVTAGGRVARHLHQLDYDVRAGPPDPAWLSPILPDGLAVAPYGPVSPSLAATRLAAYPPTHPDHHPAVSDVAATQETLDRYRTGEVVGPFLDGLSATAVDASGAAWAALVVCEMRALETWPGGPWVTDVFVHPTYAGRGVASALLRRTLAGAADTDYPLVGLSVTDGNPARSMYERLGFRRSASFWSVMLPG